MTAPTMRASAAMFAGSRGPDRRLQHALRGQRRLPLVSVVTISTVRANTEPRIADTIPEHRPAAGLKAADAWHTPCLREKSQNRPVTNPATASRGRGAAQSTYRR